MFIGHDNISTQIRSPIMAELVAAQRGPACALVDFMHDVSSRVFAAIEGEPADIASYADESAVQPILPSFEHVPDQGQPGWCSDVWPADVKATIDHAARLLRANAFEPKGSLDVNADEALLEIIFASENQGDAHMTPLLYFLSCMVIRSDGFHAAVYDALSSFGELKAGLLKKYARAAAKVGLHGDYYEQKPGPPYCRHLKDMLRASLFVRTHAALKAGFDALVERFGKPAVVKNRLLEGPHDILVVLWSVLPYPPPSTPPQHTT